MATHDGQQEVIWDSDGWSFSCPKAVFLPENSLALPKELQAKIHQGPIEVSAEQFT